MKRVKTPDLDRLDRKLLSAVQRDASLTHEQLAEHVGLSASAISRRLQRLDRTGVIQERIAVLDPAKLGRGSTLVVGIEVERERQELADALRRWLRRESWVQQAYYVTGSADYVLIVSAPDMAGFDEFMTRLMIENPNVRRFTTNVVLSAVKRGLHVPVD